MNLSLPPLGQKLKISFVAILTSSILYLISVLFPLSKGDIYQNRLNYYRFLVRKSLYTQADLLEPKLESDDILYFASRHHPRFISKFITDILKKPDRTTDDLIEVSLLYYKMGDLDNSRHFLLLASQNDPIRSDINKLYHQLF